jgi:hypothetical protein
MVWGLPVRVFGQTVPSARPCQTSLAAYLAKNGNGRLGILADDDDHIPRRPVQFECANRDRGVSEDLIGTW